MSAGCARLCLCAMIRSLCNKWLCSISHPLALSQCAWCAWSDRGRWQSFLVGTAACARRTRVILKARARRARSAAGRSRASLPSLTLDQGACDAQPRCLPSPLGNRRGLGREIPEKDRCVAMPLPPASGLSQGNMRVRRYSQLQLHVAVPACSQVTHSVRAMQLQLPTSPDFCKYRSNRYSQFTRSLTCSLPAV